MLLDHPHLNRLTGDVLGAAIEVHRVLGPGLLESTYMACLQFELHAREQRFTAQRPVSLTYKGVRLQSQYRIDLLVEETVLVEVKAVDAIAPIHQAQLLTYLKLTGCPVGLLINFNVPKLMKGVRRLINLPA